MSRNADLRIGPLSAKSSDAAHFTLRGPQFATPTVVHPATMPGGSLQLAKEWNSARRPGADDHLRHPSKGVRC